MCLPCGAGRQDRAACTATEWGFFREGAAGSRGAGARHGPTRPPVGFAPDLPKRTVLVP